MNKLVFKKLTAIMIALLMVLCFTACGSKDSGEPEEQEPEQEMLSETEDLDEEEDEETTQVNNEKPPVVGGWEVYGDTKAVELPEGVQEAFDDVVFSLSGSEIIPIAFIGEQVVAGSNYEILCINKPEEEGAEPELQVLVIYRDLEDNAELIGGNVFKIDAYTQGQGADNAGEVLAGGWFIPKEFTLAKDIPAEAKAAFDKAYEGFDGNALSPVAYLGSQLVSGTNYAFLCHSSLVTAESVEAMQVVIVYEDLDGNASFSNIYTLDLASFNE